MFFCGTGGRDFGSLGFDLWALDLMLECLALDFEIKVQSAFREVQSTELKVQKHQIRRPKECFLFDFQGDFL